MNIRTAAHMGTSGARLSADAQINAQPTTVKAMAQALVVIARNAFPMRLGQRLNRAVGRVFRIARNDLSATCRDRQ
jgi:hypothetical protein